MIKATDLRIGNLIYPMANILEHVTVTDVDEDGAIGTTAYFDGMKGCTGSVVGWAQGVPLTPDWLLQMGFAKDRCGWNLPGTQFSLTDKYYPCWMDRMLWPQDIPDFKHLSLKYVHQLQNLYYVLTMGEDLAIKETV